MSIVSNIVKAETTTWIENLFYRRQSGSKFDSFDNNSHRKFEPCFSRNFEPYFDRNFEPCYRQDFWAMFSSKIDVEYVEAWIANVELVKPELFPRWEKIQFSLLTVDFIIFAVILARSCSSSCRQARSCQDYYVARR